MTHDRRVGPTADSRTVPVPGSGSADVLELGGRRRGRARTPSPLDQAGPHLRLAAPASGSGATPVPEPAVADRAPGRRRRGWRALARRAAVAFAALALLAAWSGTRAGHAAYPDSGGPQRTAGAAGSRVELLVRTADGEVSWTSAAHRAGALRTAALPLHGTISLSPGQAVLADTWTFGTRFLDGRTLAARGEVPAAVAAFTTDDPRSAWVVLSPLGAPSTVQRVDVGTGRPAGVSAVVPAGWRVADVQGAGLVTLVGPGDDGLDRIAVLPPGAGRPQPITQAGRYLGTTPVGIVWLDAACLPGAPAPAGCRLHVTYAGGTVDVAPPGAVGVFLPGPAAYDDDGDLVVAARGASADAATVLVLVHNPTSSPLVVQVLAGSRGADPGAGLAWSAPATLVFARSAAAGEPLVALPLDGAPRPLGTELPPGATLLAARPAA